MDRFRSQSPLYARQRSTSSSTSSPSMSPAHRHVRSGSASLAGGLRRPQQNYSARAAKERLARVMAAKTGDEEDEDEEEEDGGFGPVVLRPKRAIRSPSPTVVNEKLASKTGDDEDEEEEEDNRGFGRVVFRPKRTVRSPSPAVANEKLARAILSKTEDEEEEEGFGPVVLRPKRAVWSPSPAAANEKLARFMASKTGHEEEEDEDEGFGPVMLQPKRVVRSPSPAIGRYLADQSPTIRSASPDLSPLVAKPAGQPALIPSVKSFARPSYSLLSPEGHLASRRQKRASVDIGALTTQNIENSQSSCDLTTQHAEQTPSSSVLEVEVDALREENKGLNEKLQLVEERCMKAEAKVQQLQKQISVKCKVKTGHARNDEASALRLELETARDEAASAMEGLQGAEEYTKNLQILADKLVLTADQMEEVILKRCWLARYWKLCVQYGVLPEIAEDRCEYWSSLAPSPFEAVISAGHKAREKASLEGDEVVERRNIQPELYGANSDTSIESMLLVEKGLCELALLKVEDAISFMMAHYRRSNSKPAHPISELKESIDSQNPLESFDLTKEECEDVLFKQAWLLYFWTRAKNYSLEVDIAEERLHVFVNQSAESPTCQDAIDVERGLQELRRLGIESQLWEASKDPSNRSSRNEAFPSISTSKYTVILN